MILLLLIIIIPLIYYYYVYKPHHYWKNLNVPYIKPVPVMGNMHKIFLKKDGLHGWVQGLYEAQQTKISGIYSFNLPVLLLRDLDLIKKIGIKEFDHFADHRPFISEEIDPLFGKNLFALRGEKWRKMRATLSPAFTSSKIRTMFVLMSDSAKQLTQYFEEIVDSNKPYELELKDTFSRFANDVIATTAFGIQCNSLKDKDNEFYLMGKDATNTNGIQAMKFFMYHFSKTLMRLMRIQIFSKKVREFFRNIIKTTLITREREGIVRPDMIHLLMEARKGKLKRNGYCTIKIFRDGSGANGNTTNEVEGGVMQDTNQESAAPVSVPLKHEVQKDDDAGFATVHESEVGKDSRLAKIDLTDDDITAQALLFFIAGFDTTSSAMCFMSYELALNPDIQQRLQEEIDETFETNNGKLTYDVVMKMKYLDMVLTESLRKWPPLAALDRMCTDAITITAEEAEGETIHMKKNDLAWIPLFAIHRDPQYYPDPEKFNPERFSEENKGNINPMAYMPFGVGPRSCIGSRFALMETKIMFVHILSTFSFVRTEKTQDPIVLTKGDIILNGENGIWVELRRRTTI